MTNQKGFCLNFNFSVIILVLFLLLHFNNGFKLKDISTTNRKNNLKTNENEDEASFKIVKSILKTSNAIDNEDNSKERENLEFKFEKVHEADHLKHKIINKNKLKDNTNLENDNTLKNENFHKSDLSFFSLLNKTLNWLKSFRNISSTKSEEVAENNDNSWISYLDRWPFNLFYQSKIKVKRSKTGYNKVLESKSENNSISLNKSDFNLLLQSLPSFALDATNIVNSECKTQLDIFRKHLRDYKYWAIQMYDATAKVPSGLLKGNIIQFGEFELCTSIKRKINLSKDKKLKIRGKYCLAEFDLRSKDKRLKALLHLLYGKYMWKGYISNRSHIFPRYINTRWGICIPNACSSNDVTNILRTNLGRYNKTGLDIEARVKFTDCYVKRPNNYLKLFMSDWNFKFAILYFILHILLVSIGTCLDNLENLKILFVDYLFATTAKNFNNGKEEKPIENHVQKPSTAPILEIFQKFSLRQNIPQLIGYNVKETPFAGLEILSALATFGIYLIFKIFMLGHLPITNKSNFTKSIRHPLSVLLRIPLIYFEILLFVNGAKTAYHECTLFELKNDISILCKFLMKLLRHLPTLLVVIFFQSWILPQLNLGPLWGSLITHNSVLCEQNLWPNIFGMQNIKNFEDSCLPATTIQLAVEIQLYLLVPLIIWLFYNNKEIALVVYSAIHIISIASRYHQTIDSRLSSIVFYGINSSQMYRTANILFSSPINRATSYLFGIGVGIFLHNYDIQPKISKGSLIFGWIAALWCLGWCLFYPINSSKTEFIYDPLNSAVYSSWSPFLLCSGLFWIIMMTPNRFFIQIISQKCIYFWSNVSYCIQMLVCLVVLYNTAIIKESINFHLLEVINITEILVIIMISTLCAVFVDIPARNLCNLFMKYTSKSNNQNMESVVEVNQEDIENDTAKNNSTENKYENNSIN